MQPYGSITRLKPRLLFGALSMLAVGHACATQPLFDQYTDGQRSGYIFPAECCYLELPDDRRIRDLRRQRMGSCSAAGGPVGVFRREGGKLWLTSLAECTGPIPLKTLYADLEGPVVAKWLSGTFTAHLDHCYGAGLQSRYAVTHTLEIEKGVVKSVAETRNDVSDCKH